MWDTSPNFIANRNSNERLDRTFKTGVRYSATPSAVPFILFITSCIAMMENCSGKVLFIVQSDGELLRNLTSIVTRQDKTQTWVHMFIRASAEQFGAVGSSRNASKTKSRYARFKHFFLHFCFPKFLGSQDQKCRWVCRRIRNYCTD